MVRKLIFVFVKTWELKLVWEKHAKACPNKKMLDNNYNFDENFRAK